MNNRTVSSPKWSVNQICMEKGSGVALVSESLSCPRTQNPEKQHIAV